VVVVVVVGLGRMMVATTRMREREQAPGEGGLFGKLFIFSQHTQYIDRSWLASVAAFVFLSFFFLFPPALLFWLEGCVFRYFGVLTERRGGWLLSLLSLGVALSLCSTELLACLVLFFLPAPRPVFLGHDIRD
jgi:hypothetical protein